MEGLEAAPPDSGTGSVCSDYTEDGEVAEAAVKRRIQPDDLAISKLLNFNEVIQYYTPTSISSTNCSNSILNIQY